MASESGTSAVRPVQKSGLGALFATSVALLALYALLYLIFLRNGYGDNLDNYGMLNSWQAMAAYGSYFPSRFQGNIPSEFALGFLATLGGPAGSNAVSLAASLASLLLIGYILSTFITDPWQIILCVLTVALNPIWINASMTSMDYVHPIALFLAGVVAMDRRLPVLSVLLLAIAGACRISFFPLGLAALMILWHFRTKPEERSLTAQSVVVYFLICGLFYLPVFISSHLSLTFLTSARPNWQGIWGLVARAVYKSLYLYGPLGSIVVVWWFTRCLYHPTDSSGDRKGRRHLVSRICYAIVLYHAGLFFYIPVRIEYLFPILCAFAVLFAINQASKKLLTMLCITQVIYWIVSIDLLKIEHRSNDACAAVQAVDAKLSPHIVAGVLRPKLLHETNESRCLHLLASPTEIHERLPRPIVSSRRDPGGSVVTTGNDFAVLGSD